MEERLVAGERLEPKQLDEIAQAACSVSSATKDPNHAILLMRVYPRANLVPGTSVVEAIGALAVTMHTEMRPAVDDLLEWVRVASDQTQLTKLEHVVNAMEAASARGDPDQTTRNPVLS